MAFPKDTQDMKELFLALFAEFLATLLYVYMGCLSVIASAELSAYTPNSGGEIPNVARIMPIAMAFGMSVMVLAYSVGNLSGGHINPAVSVFLCLIKQMSPLRAILYIVAQILGSLLGAALLLGSTSGLAFSREGVEKTPYALGATLLNPELTTGNGFLLECMGTLFVIFVVFNTAVRSGGPSDGQPNLAPLCIGFAVFVAHLVLVPLTGCGINPARSIGPSLIDSFAGNSDGWEKNSWIYYIAPLTASVFAAALHFIFDLADDLPIDWDVFDEDDSGQTQSSDKSTIEVRKYRKPSSIPTTGYASSNTQKLKHLLKTSGKIRRNQRIVPDAHESSKSSEPGQSGKSSVFDVYEGQASHKFPPRVVGGRTDVEEGPPVVRDPDSHKFPTFAASPAASPAAARTVEKSDSGTLHAPQVLPSVQAPAGRITATLSPEAQAANSHKFPPKH